MLWEACCCNCYGRGRSLLLPAVCGKSCSAASRLPRNGVQLLGGFRGWRMPILPRSNMFFSKWKWKTSEDWAGKYQDGTKMNQAGWPGWQWLQVTEAIQIIHFFFVRLLHVACCSGDWPLAQNLWRFESAALNTILDVAEVKAGERENKRANFTSNLMFIQRNCASQWLHCSCHDMQWYSVHSLQCALWPVIVRPFFFGPSAEHWLSLS